MKKILCFAIAALMLFCLTSAGAEGTEKAEGTDGTEEPLWLLDDLDTIDIYGEKADASLLADCELIMVNVWATYCGPCVNELAELGRLAEDWEPKGVRIVGLVSDAVDSRLEPDESQLAAARDIAEQTGAAYPHLVPDLRLAMKVLAGIQYVPTTFFVTPDGALTGNVWVGARSYDGWNTVIEDTLKELRAE